MMCEFLQRDCFLNYPQYFSSLSFLLFECNSNGCLFDWQVDKQAVYQSCKWSGALYSSTVILLKVFFYFLYFSETVIFMINW